MRLQGRNVLRLGKGLRIQINNQGASIVGSYRWLKFNIGKKGISTTASIPGTDVSYTKDIPLPSGLKRFKTARIEVVEKNTVHGFFTNSIPDELKSNTFKLQSALGVIGIISIFASFIRKEFFIIGVALIYLKSLWRRKTDAPVVAYKNAYKFFRGHKPVQCIEELKKVLQHPAANRNLKLVMAECYLQLEDSNKAYEMYSDYFNTMDAYQLDSTVYWSPKANGILLSIERGNYDLALKISESLQGENSLIDFKLWKNYFKGLAFMGLKEYEAAIHAFKDAVGKKRNMEEPYIDAHYLMGMAYGAIGKNSLAKERFQRVFSGNSNYREVSRIIKEMGEGRRPTDIVKEILE